MQVGFFFFCEYCPDQWLMHVTVAVAGFILTSFGVASILVPSFIPNDDVINLFFINKSPFNIFLLVMLLDPGPIFVPELSLAIFWPPVTIGSVAGRS